MRDEYMIIPGTVSHGTLRPEDLLPRFLDELRDISPAHYTYLIHSVHGEIYRAAIEGTLGYDARYIGVELALDYLYDVLDELGASKGYYFGASEGDGSDIGFWPIEAGEDD